MLKQSSLNQRLHPGRSRPRVKRRNVAALQTGGTDASQLSSKQLVPVISIEDADCVYVIPSITDQHRLAVTVPSSTSVPQVTSIISKSGTDRHHPERILFSKERTISSINVCDTVPSLGLFPAISSSQSLQFK